MAKLVWRNALLGGAVWLVGTLAVRYFRHGLVTREDLFDAVILSAFVVLVVFLSGSWRARRQRNSDKSDAA
jgi:hypothetical protein